MALVVERFDDIGVIRLSRWIFNCYLIRGENSYVVVDPGMPGSADDVGGVLAVLHGAVGAVAATHGHSDHVAGAPRLAAEHGVDLHLPEAGCTLKLGERYHICACPEFWADVEKWRGAAQGAAGR